jgi:hypothetical protein
MNNIETISKGSKVAVEVITKQGQFTTKVIKVLQDSKFRIFSQVMENRYWRVNSIDLLA